MAEYAEPKWMSAGSERMWAEAKIDCFEADCCYEKVNWMETEAKIDWWEVMYAEQ